MNKFNRIGIDLAKNVFQLHGTDRHSKVLMKPVNVQVHKARRSDWELTCE